MACAHTTARTEAREKLGLPRQRGIQVAGGHQHQPGDVGHRHATCVRGEQLVRGAASACVARCEDRREGLSSTREDRLDTRGSAREDRLDTCCTTVHELCRRASRTLYLRVVCVRAGQGAPERHAVTCTCTCTCTCQHSSEPLSSPRVCGRLLLDSANRVSNSSRSAKEGRSWWRTPAIRAPSSSSCLRRHTAGLPGAVFVHVHG